MRVCVPREAGPGEHRVALTPETVKRLLGNGFEIVVERGAGVLAGFPDDLYEDAGAELAQIRCHDRYRRSSHPLPSPT